MMQFERLKAVIAETGGTAIDAQNVLVGLFMAVRCPEWAQAFVEITRRENPDGELLWLGAQLVVDDLPISSAEPEPAR